MPRTAKSRRHHREAPAAAPLDAAAAPLDAAAAPLDAAAAPQDAAAAPPDAAAAPPDAAAAPLYAGAAKVKKTISKSKSQVKKVRAKSAYSFFAAEHRKTLPEGTPFADASRACSEAWNVTEDRSKWEALGRRRDRPGAAPPPGASRRPQVLRRQRKVQQAPSLTESSRSNVRACGTLGEDEKRRAAARRDGLTACGAAARGSQTSANRWRVGRMARAELE